MPVADKDFAEVKSKVLFVESIIPRMDAAIEKLSDVAGDVSKLLAGHEARLEYGDKQFQNITEILERHRLDDEQKHHEIHEKINGVKLEAESKISTLKEDLIRAIDAGNDKIAKRIKPLEKWMWALAGGGAAIGFLVSAIVSYVSHGSITLPNLH